MLLISLMLALGGIPVSVHSGQVLYTDLSGNSLYASDRVYSMEPGCGRNVVSSGYLFWKECASGADQQVIRDDGRRVFSREYFSGPFPSPADEGFIVSVPDEILVMNDEGTILESFYTGEYPGSLASGGGFIWFVSSEYGCLSKLDTATGIISTVPLDFVPLTVEYGSGMLLLERAEGGYSICETSGEEVNRMGTGFMARFISRGTLSFAVWDETDGCETLSWEIAEYSMKNGTETRRPLQLVSRNLLPGEYDDPSAHFDVPYMHQRWDTPDWFNGSWSCGPTSCMMAVQYYNRLTPDSIWCSYPEGHWSQWGNYIPVEYTFLGHTYDIMGLAAPGTVWVPGSHGFICRDAGGAYWSYMVLWMQQHGLDSSYLGTTWSACTTELDGSWPVVASTTSPYTGGHILLFNGYYDNHSVICNDAYGDQNESGWGNYYNGKDVVYDWPGYNNGNVELGISQLFRARSEVLSAQGTLVDDRTHGYRKLGPCQYWHEQAAGYSGYSWWTYSTGALPDTCFVEWIPELPSSGMYTVATYIPSSHATATGIYHISTQSGWETVYLNQGSYSDQWVNLGTWNLNPTTAMVKMGDYTGTQGEYISFDAVRFIQETGTAEEWSGAVNSLFSPLNNPCPSSGTVQFSLPRGFSGEITIYDTTGRIVTETASKIPPGVLSPGIYFASIDQDGDIAVTRFTVTE